MATPDNESDLHVISHVRILVASRDACGSEDVAARLPSSFALKWTGTKPGPTSTERETHHFTMFILKDPRLRIGVATAETPEGLWCGSRDLNENTIRVEPDAKKVLEDRMDIATSDAIIASAWSDSSSRELIESQYTDNISCLYQKREDGDFTITPPKLEFLTANSWDNLPPHLRAVIKDQVSFKFQPLEDPTKVWTMNAEDTQLLKRMADDTSSLSADFDHSKILFTQENDKGNWSIW